MPDQLEQSEEAQLQQDTYDKLIHYSKEIWSESAAGGFAKRKFPIDVEKPVSSPLLIPKDYGPSKKSSIKTLNKIKLNTMSSGMNSAIYENIDSVLA